MKYCEHDYPEASHCPACETKTLRERIAALEAELAKAREVVRRLVGELSCYTRTALGDAVPSADDAVRDGLEFLGPAAPKHGGQAP